MTTPPRVLHVNTDPTGGGLFPPVRTGPALYIVGPNPDGDGEEWAMLVYARDEAHALALARCEDDSAAVVRVAEWERQDAPPPIPRRGREAIHWGAWNAPVHVLAGYGIQPDEDWRRCDCCGAMLEDEDFAEPDSNDCMECEADDDGADQSP